MIRALLVALALSCSAASAAFCGDRDACTARLDRTAISVGEDVLLRVEVSGECAVDSELAELPRVDGLLFEPSGGPEIAVRTRGGPEHGTEYLAEYRVRVAALRPGEFEVRGVVVRCSTGEELEANPVRLKAVGAETAPMLRLSVTPDRARVWRRQPFSVRVRLEVDARLMPDLMGGKFELPWQDDLVALPGAPETGVGGPSGDVRTFETGAGKRPIRLGSAGKNSGAFECVRWFVAPEAGSIDFSRSSFTIGGPRTGDATRLHAGPAVEARADAARLEILPLPAPASADVALSGAVVGPVSLDVAAARTDVTVGEPLAVTIRVASPSPTSSCLALAELAIGKSVTGFRVFERRETSAAPASATRVVELSVSPVDAGVSSFPALALDWFDPDRGAWSRAESAPVALSVKPHPGGVDLADARENRPADEEGAGEALVVGAMIGLVLCVAAAIAFAVRKAERATPRLAETALSTFERELGAAPQNDTLAAARAFARFIAAVSGGGAGDAFGADVATRLAERGVPKDVVGAVSDYFERVEAAAFSRGGAAPATPRAELLRLARAINGQTG